jgi:hypothetical protein
MLTCIYWTLEFIQVMWTLEVVPALGKILLARGTTTSMDTEHTWLVSVIFSNSVVVIVMCVCHFILISYLPYLFQELLVVLSTG